LGMSINLFPRAAFFILSSLKFIGHEVRSQFRYASYFCRLSAAFHRPGTMPFLPTAQ
jgi:hypothetical protein